MNCVNHPELAAAAYCRSCGKALCQDCARTAQGTIYCEEHVPAQPALASPSDSPWTAPPAPAPGSPDPGASPGLAFLLGLIPGVGAIYNGQYAKGLIHVIILGFLISILNSGAAGGLEPVFGLVTAVWYFYMPFEAYHTAKKRQLGQPVDEFSSLVPMRGTHTNSPVAPVVLIVLGVLFLLNNLDLLNFYYVLRYWPVFLIALGGYMLYVRFKDSEGEAVRREASNEQQ